MTVNTEQGIMQIIASSGDSRSLSFEALRLAKEGQIDEARKKISEANERLTVVHRTQFEFISAEASGKPVEMSLLMVHAQDHLMTSILSKDLISEIIGLCEKLLTEKGN